MKRVRTDWQEVEIWQSDRVVEFRAEGATHAWHHRERFLTGLAWDMIAAGCLLRPDGPPRSVLMLGVAGGTSLRTLRHLLPDCELTGIELDGALLDLARERMDLGAIGAEIIHDDAWSWLAANRRTFDVVVDDLYLAGTEDVYRPHALDEERLRLLERAVAANGHLAVNLVTGTGHRRVQSHTRAMLRARKPVVKTLTTPGGLNEVLVAGSGIAGRRRLSSYESCFPHWKDRGLWRLLEIRTLKGGV
jgi:spermidine synthase